MSTLQIATAQQYYAESVMSLIYTYQQIGTDGLGRRVYQMLLDGELYGEPKALLTYREYAAKVQHWAKLDPNMGVQRWTRPY